MYLGLIETKGLVGAIEAAPSDPSVIYIGMGDLITGGGINEGNGVYKSVDAGKTWQHLGLDETKQLPSILVDPHDPIFVLVAAQGNVHTHSEERGVFRSSEIDASLEGMAAAAEEAILAKGLSPVTRDVSPLHSGTAMGGDVLLAVSPRLSIGAGFGYTRANSASVYTYNQVLNLDYTLDNTALLQVYAYRLDAATTIPLNPKASLVLCAGPALYQAKYIHTMAWVDASSSWNLRQDVRQSTFGGHASLALEISLNDRVGLFAQALGRLVRFTSLAGTETLLREDHSYGLPTLTYAGDLYIVEDDSFSQTAVRSTPPSGPGAVRKAVLDFSGVDFLFGFRVKF